MNDQTISIGPRLLAITAACSLACACAVQAGWVPGAKLTSFPAAATGERFGFCNANNGTYLAVGAPDARVGTQNGAGAVYMFKQSGGDWVSTVKLNAPAPQFGTLAFAEFGTSVAISHDTLVVGAWGYPSAQGAVFSGAAFVFVRHTPGDDWDLAATIRASDGVAIDQFGWSVSVDVDDQGNGVIAVGKILDGTGNTGAVYVYEGGGATWTEKAKLAPGDLAASDQFGSSVSVRGTELAAGTQKQNNGGANAGAVYVFDRTAGVWSQTVKLLPADLAAGDAFGASVSLGDGILVVGSPGKKSGTTVGVGGAYILEGSGTTWAATAVTARDPNQNDAFGYSVAIQRPDVGGGPTPIVVVGAPGYDSGDSNNGAAFIFIKTGSNWGIDTTDMWVTGSLANGALGRSVSVSPDATKTVFSSETPGTSTGAAYGFTLMASGGAPSPGANGTPGGGSGGPITGGGVPPTGIDTPGGGGGGGGGGSGGSGAPAPTKLPALAAPFGTVLGTVIMVDEATHTIMAMQTDGVNAGHKPKVDIIDSYPDNLRLLAAPDLNGDGSGDLLFYDQNTHGLVVWLRDGLTIIKKVEIDTLPDGFEYCMYGDFNADTIDDIVLRNPSNGDLKVWQMDSTATNATIIDVDIPDNHWTPVKVDINGDGHPDLILRQPDSGEVVQVGLPAASGDPPTFTHWPDAASDYELLAGGDIDGDGQVDLIWRHGDDFEVWFLKSDLTERERMRLVLDANSWRIEKVHDFDGNGKADFLLSRNGSGHLVVVYMDFTTRPRVMKSKMLADIDDSVKIIDFAPR